jgi:hypothetical protein
MNDTTLIFVFIFFYYSNLLPSWPWSDDSLLLNFFFFFGAEKFAVPKYQVVHVNSKARRKRSTGSGNELGSHPDHVISLSALGKDYHLHLQHNEDFYKKHRTLPMFGADYDERGEFSYEKLKESVSDTYIASQFVDLFTYWH